MKIRAKLPNELNSEQDLLSNTHHQHQISHRFRIHDSKDTIHRAQEVRHKDRVQQHQRLTTDPLYEQPLRNIREHEREREDEHMRDTPERLELHKRPQARQEHEHKARDEPPECRRVGRLVLEVVVVVEHIRAALPLLPFPHLPPLLSTVTILVIVVLLLCVVKDVGYAHERHGEAHDKDGEEGHVHSDVGTDPPGEVRPLGDGLPDGRNDEQGEDHEVVHLAGAEGAELHDPGEVVLPVGRVERDE